MPALPASRTEARDDFAAWGRNHQKRSTTALRRMPALPASRTEARDDFAAWGRNHQKRSTTAWLFHGHINHALHDHALAKQSTDTLGCLLQRLELP